MKLLAIDGNSIMNRAYYGIKILTNSKGFFTNAITGFMNIFLKEMDIVKPDSVVVAFDLKAPTFRHKAVKSYKANRKGMPNELAQQMPVIKEILVALGVKVVEIEGFEADDVLGTISKISKDNNSECFVLTGDRDSLQLVNDTVTVRLATTKETVIYNPEKINEVYGINPLDLIEVKALMGDSSDNISGVAGIGEKTALKLVKEYKTLENLYENYEESKLTNSVKTKLANGKDDAFQSRFLATICLDVPIDNNIENYKIAEKDIDKISEILSDLEMFKLLDRLGGQAVKTNKNTQKPKDRKEYKVFEIDNNTVFDNTIYFIYDNKNLFVFNNDSIYYTENEELILKILSLSNEKMTYNAKPAYKMMMKNNMELANVSFCCDLAGYILNSMASEYTVENLCKAYDVDYRDDIENYADIASLFSLCEALLKQVDDAKMHSLLYDIEQPLCEVLASMEVDGIKVDVDGVKEFGDNIKNDIEILQKEIFELAGKEFNVSSPKQLGVVLFEDLGLPVKKKTKTGYSTNADVLESLKDKHPIIQKIIDYRTLTKLNSTYVEGLIKEIKDDGRVHSIFKQTETKTGRISSTEPNMQNIPVRKEIGRNMRKFFVAKDGYTLLDADYSQIELRVLAHVCDDQNMQNAFLGGKDIHTTTAAQVFGVPDDFVTAEMRSAAKAVNFGIIYGIGAFSLSKDINVSVADADKYIKQYLNNYPKVNEFMETVVDNAKEDGFVTTMFGRRRYIPELKASNKMIQAFGKRAAMNAPIQGAAADIIKIAMVKVYQKLKDLKIDAKLILQVHDELIIEVLEKDKDVASQILRDEMEKAVSLKVPMIADVNQGKSWFDAKG